MTKYEITIETSDADDGRWTESANIAYLHGFARGQLDDHPAVRELMIALADALERSKPFEVGDEVRWRETNEVGDEVWWRGTNDDSVVYTIFGIVDDVAAITWVSPGDQKTYHSIASLSRLVKA